MHRSAKSAPEADSVNDMGQQNLGEKQRSVWNMTSVMLLIPYVFYLTCCDITSHFDIFFT